MFRMRLAEPLSSWSTWISWRAGNGRIARQSRSCRRTGIGWSGASKNFHT